VRTLPLEALDEYYQRGHVSEETFLWKAGMKEWQKLEVVLAEHPEPETPFHVLMDDGSVRLLTVEQIDDFYRLELIGEDTLLWQQGMPSWAPLSHLADEVDDEGELVTDPVAARVPQRNASAAAPSRLEHAVVTTVRPNPIELRIVASANTTSPAVRQSAAVKPAASHWVQEPLLPSTPPVALSLIPSVVETPKVGGAERWFLRLAVAAGLIVVFGRNDAFFVAAGAANQSAAYLDTEQRTFGGPAFGTPRAVQDLLKSTGGSLEPVRVPVVAAQILATPAEKKVASNDAKAAPNTVAGDIKKTEPTPPPPAAKAPQAASTPPTLSGNVAAALLGKAKPKASVPSRAKAPSRRPASRSKGSAATGSGSYYDPLNGAL
jgi:hypothetical protein